MRPITTRLDKINKKINALKSLKYDIEKERDSKIEELEKYAQKHQSINFGGLATSCVPALKKIYDYMDKRYPIEWWHIDHPRAVNIDHKDNVPWLGANWVEWRPAIPEEIELHNQGKWGYFV